MTSKDAATALRDLGFKVWIFSIPRRAFAQLTGVPDLYGIHVGRGVGLWVEVKTDHDKLRPAQEEFREAATAAEIPYLVVYSVDELIKGLGFFGLL